jgi:preprotein translocase subunit SecD
LTVTRAEVVAGTGPANSIEVSFTLGSKDAAAFDQLAAANVGQRVAIVMFGRVLSAPVIQQASFNGRGVITGLDSQTAADVIAALSR